ncbi:hypothetical protein DM860_009073 [Cuscuta australis]|uniref:Uncharacterized protein n=1 Tax=Cuscuta australis TaxID=267555 RepID=A0A328DC72_9ASTE|nr:hypothetical protein DM860_009073 [Cuscuta australis]
MASFDYSIYDISVLNYWFATFCCDFGWQDLIFIRDLGPLARYLTEVLNVESIIGSCDGDVDDGYGDEDEDGYEDEDGDEDENGYEYEDGYEDEDEDGDGYEDEDGDGYEDEDGDGSEDEDGDGSEDVDSPQKGYHDPARPEEELKIDG